MSFIKTHHNEHGIALILVIWVLLLLMIIVMEFSFAMRQEANATRNYKDEIDCYFYALSGFEEAIAQLLKEASLKPEEREDLSDKIPGEVPAAFDDESTEQMWRDDQRTITLSMGRGSVEVVIANENGKWNLNVIPEDKLRALVDTLVEDEVERDTITDSILDWIDENDLHHLNGVEDDYYESLEKPYPCKDAPFDTVEELLQVRGITPGLLYGFMENSIDEDGEAVSGLQKGLVDMVSIYGTTNVNINAAPKEVLMSTGFAEEEADQIIAAREEEPITNVTEVVDQPGKPVNVGSRIAMGGTYSIVATGVALDSEIRRRIKGVVRISPHSKEKFTILYWADNYPIAENLVNVGKNMWEQS